MVNKSLSYPIDGASVAAVLEAAATPEEKWLVTSIETLSDGEAPSLGELWRLSQEGPVEISTLHLCGALGRASQVVSLDLRLSTNAAIELLIEDGSVVNNRLTD